MKRFQSFVRRVMAKVLMWKEQPKHLSMPCVFNKIWGSKDRGRTGGDGIPHSFQKIAKITEKDKNMCLINSSRETRAFKQSQVISDVSQCL
jgi:hypothetical protein